MAKIKAIITGATGMVGEGVLLECLQNPAVESVLVLGRRSCGMTHPKLKEVVHADLYNVAPLTEQLTGYNACYFCLGTTSVGMQEPEYFKITYSLTLGIAKVLSQQNPDMTFCYVSGAGTDGRSMWARVKRKTEDDLTQLPFKQVFNFRPGYMQPTKGQRNTLSFYKWIKWMYPMFRVVFKRYVTTLQELALAMIHVTERGYEKQVLEVKDIVKAAK
jgi:uncharacterized protein YbjT (DUF2867 family)